VKGMKGFFSQLKVLISWGSTIWKLLSLLGWQGPVLALSISLLGWGWAHLQGVPTSLAVMASLPVFVTLLYLFKLPAFIAGTNEISGLIRPDYKLWARLDRYSLGHAACLMAGVQPTDNPAFMPGNAGVYHQLLYQAIRTRQLDAHTPHLQPGQPDPLFTQGQPPNWATVILRKDLQKFYSDQKNFVLPKFLKD
jgi:hypothetical protein